MAKKAASSQVLADLVTANRILAYQNVLDGYGHVSARCEDDPEQFYIGDATPPGNVRAKNVFRWTLDSQPAGHEQPTYGERFIHGEIYRVRPDVNAIVHCHAPELIPFHGAGIPLRPIYHMAGFQGEDPLPVFEIREHFGPETDMLIRTSEPGRGARAIARRPPGRADARSRCDDRRTVDLASRAVCRLRGRQCARFGASAAVRRTTDLSERGRRPQHRHIMGDGSRTWDYLARLATAT